MPHAERARVKRVLHDALELSADDRDAFLDESCAGEPDLRSEIGALLGALEGAGDFLDSPTSGGTLPSVELLTEATQVGRYRLVRKIGEGGFGSVWLAEQHEPVVREVALKITKLGMDTQQVVARFEAERQALALMDHPNIARVLDGGATETGRPFFVMELIRGEPITEYCEGKELETRERLELFLQVCHAVRHAHGRGILHRDLKPGNVLMSEHSGEPVPKVIDFGIAKALGEPLTQTRLVTGSAQIMGTLQYMSPERFASGPGAVDVRSDVYSLGVLLYELLYSKPPHDFTNKTLLEVAQMVQDERPAPASAEQRGPRGDLETIVGKALRKEPEQRYDTVAALEADLLHFLRKEPITARPTSAMYQLKLFARRNTAVVVSVACVLVVSLVATAVSVGWALEARRHALDASRRLYSSTMMRASEEVRAGDLGGARESLEDAPEELRGWEWRHLRSRAVREALVLEVGDGKSPMAFSRDGSRLAVLGSTRESRWIELLEWPGGSLLRKIPLPSSDTVTAIEFSSDGSELLLTGTAHSAGSVGTWLWRRDAETGRELWSRRLPEGLGPQSFAWLGESEEFVWRDSSGLHVGDLGSVPARRSRLRPLIGAAVLSLSPDGRTLVVSEDGDDVLQLFDPRTLEPIGRLGSLEGPISTLAISADGRVGSASMSGQIQVWAGLGAEPLNLPGDGMAIRRLEFQPDGARLVSTHGDGTIRIWDSSSGVRQADLRRQASPFRWSAFDPSQAARLAMVAADATVRFRDLDQLAEPNVLRGHEDYVYAVAIDAEAGMILSGGWDGWAKRMGGPRRGALRWWDADSGEEVERWGEHGVRVYDVKLSARRAHVLISTPALGPLQLTSFDTRTWRELGAVDVVHGYGGVAFDSFRQQLLCSTQSSRGAKPELTLLDAGSGRRIRSLPAEEIPRSFLALSTNGRWLAAAGLQHIALCDAETFELDRILTGFSKQLITHVAFHPDSQRFVSLGKVDGIVRVWSVGSSDPIVLRGHTSGLLCATFSADGERLFSAGYGGNIRVWDTNTWQQVAVLTGHTDYVHSLVFDGENDRLISGSGDRTVRIWETRPVEARLEARGKRQWILGEVEPRVQALFDQGLEPEAVVEHVRTDATLGRRERQIALQVVLRESIERQAAVERNR